jgi:hypothetical protein
MTWNVLKLWKRNEFNLERQLILKYEKEVVSFFLRYEICTYLKSI